MLCSPQSPRLGIGSTTSGLVESPLSSRSPHRVVVVVSIENRQLRSSRGGVQSCPGFKRFISRELSPPVAPSLVAPVFLRLALYRWRYRILDLKPVFDPAR